MNWKKSFNVSKKSLITNKLKKNTKHRESIDVVLKSHRSKAQNELFPANAKFMKKRPGSAGNNQNTSKPFDVAKIHASLKLLKKSIKKSSVSGSSQRDNTNEDINFESSRGPILTPKVIENDDKYLFKRKNLRQGPRKSDFKNTKVNYSSVYNEEQKTMFQNSAMSLEVPKETPNVSRMRKIFGSEKLVRQQYLRNQNQSFTKSAVSNRDSKLRSQISSVEASEFDESIFERSAFDNFLDNKYKELDYQELYKIHMSEYKTIAQSLDQEVERKRNKYKVMLQENKITSNSFDSKLKGVEKWKKSKKKEITKKKKTIVQVLGYLQKDKFDLQNFRNTIISPEESRINAKSSLMMTDESVDSINLNKIDASDYFTDKHVTPIRDMNTSNIIRNIDASNNSHLSIVNNTYNCNLNKSVQKAHESNMSIDSSR